MLRYALRENIIRAGRAAEAVRNIGKSLRKNIWREIRSTLGRFIAIFAISALGAGFYAGLKATSPDMKATADEYYVDQHLMDYRALSTLGFTDEDIEELRRHPDVESLMAGYGVDALMERPEGSEAARVMSLPQSMDEADPDYMNRVVLMEGRLPTAPGECLMDSEPGYKLGDVVTVSNENDEGTLDMLAKKEFTVVGLARSPMYISFQRGSTTIGNGRVSYFMYVTADSFDSEYYTEVYMTAPGMESVSAFSSVYDKITERGAARIKNFGTGRVEERYDELLAEANEELGDARKELADGQKELDEAKAEADEELGKAAQEIADAEKEIADGWQEVRDNEKKLADAETEIADGAAALEEARPKLEDASKQYHNGVEQLNAKKAEYETARAQVDSLAGAVGGVQGMLDAMKGITAGGTQPPADEAQAAAFTQAAGGLSGTYRGMAAFLRQSGGQGASALADGLEAAASGGESALAAGQFETAYMAYAAVENQQANMSAALSAAGAQLDEALVPLQQAEQELADARAELDRGWAEFSENEQKVADARVEVADGKKELEDARVKLADAEKELADGKAEYETEKADAEQKIADAEEELADGQREVNDAQAELDDLPEPKWYVFTREDNPGYAGFSSDAARIESLAAVIPVFFFLVAALVCLTTMTRMVEEQRTLIGTLKGLGYSKGAIAFKYLLYAGIASASGAVAGVVLGFVAFPITIWQAYGMMYIMPSISLWNDWPLALTSVLYSVGCTMLATWAACAHELRSVPSNLMRPKAPRAGKRVLLERIRPLWKRMTFMQKVAARNLFRYKKRFFMTVIGVAGCTALLVTGFGLRDAIAGIVSRQYGDINRYDVMAVLTDSSTKGEDTRLNELLPQYGEGLYVGETLVDVESDDGSTAGMTVYVHVAEEPEKLTRFIDLHDRKTDEKLDFPGAGGAVITEKLATRLGISAGDTLRAARVNEEAVEFTVAGISENYIYNYIFITPGAYRDAFGEEPGYDTVLVNLHEGLDAEADGILEALTAAKPVAGTMDVPRLREQFDDMFQSLNAVIWLIIGAAAMLAFVVLYNLTNINITERAREIATLKVLGFYQGEVAGYIYRENLILTIIGMVAGLGLGVILHDFVIVTAEVDEVMFRRVIEPLSYVFSVLFTLLCAGLVDLAMLPRLRKVDMVESLKANE